MKNKSPIDEFDSLEKIIDQLEKCDFECEAGKLKNNIAFKALKQANGLYYKSTLYFNYVLMFICGCCFGALLILHLVK